jgi:hypothetical protein
MARLGKRAAHRRMLLLIGGTLLLLIVALAIGGLAYFKLTRPPVDDVTTLCPAAGPVGHYVLLVDRTDTLNFTQQQAFTELLHDVIERRTPEGYLLSVFVLGEDFKQTATPLIELCNPGTGADKSELTTNRRKLHRQYEERFLGPLTKVAEVLVATEPSRYSPIFEMLQMVSINAFRKHAVQGERRLLIVSDMLHNTSPFSMYKGAVDYEAFANSDYGRKLTLDLRNVKVELNILINTPQLQTKRNLAFWEAYFNKAGARIVAVRPLEG